MIRFFLARLKSFFPAFQGLIGLIRFEKNAAVHSAATFVALIASALLRISTVEWLFVILAILLVWISELFNTGLEKLSNLVEPDFHPQVKLIKDLSAAAVLLAAVFSLVVAGLIFLPKLIG